MSQMSQQEALTAQFKSVFDSDTVDRFVDVRNDLTFHIRDKTPIEVREGSPHTEQIVFSVQNPHSETITTVAIDFGWEKQVNYRNFKTEKCRGLKKGGGYLNGRCECILFNESTLCFVEIKDNETNTRKNSKKAYCQIENTYHNLLQPIQDAGFVVKDSKIEDFKVEAYVCLRNGSPSVSPRMQDAIDYFEEEYGITLSFEQQKTF